MSFQAMKIHVGTESVNYLSRLIRSLGILKRRKGSRALQKEKRTNMFSFYILCLSHFFFFFNIRTNDYTKKQFIFSEGMFWLKLCTNDYIRTMFPALGNFSSSIS